ncbi:MAG: hypothetical protein N2648_03680, partial [Aquificaceae bacterium]|nr:hypothetical protein [Aquificaceae bacterium]
GDVFDIAKRQVEQFEKVQPKLFNSCYNPAPPPEYDAIAHRYARTIGERTGALFSLPDINNSIIHNVLQKRVNTLRKIKAGFACS